MSLPRPTPAAGLPVVGALVLFQLSRITGNAWLVFAAAASIGLLMAALILRPRLGVLDATRLVSDRRAPGDTVACTFVVRNAGRRTSSSAVLEEPGDLLSGCTVYLPPLPPGAEVTAMVVRTALRRGAQRQGTAVLRSRAPFGLLTTSRNVAVSGEVLVHPRRVPAGRMPVAGGQAPLGGGEVSQPVAGVGTEVLGLRPWRPGDAARSLHARASARHGRAVVLERERDSGSALVVLVGSPGSGATWEESVARTAALATAAIRQGSPPLLLAAPPARPAPRRPDERSVLNWFAAVDEAGPLDVATVASALRAAGTGGTIALLCGSPGQVEQMARAARGEGVTVLSSQGVSDA